MSYGENWETRGTLNTNQSTRYVTRAKIVAIRLKEMFHEISPKQNRIKAIHYGLDSVTNPRRVLKVTVGTHRIKIDKRPRCCCPNWQTIIKDNKSNGMFVRFQGSSIINKEIIDIIV